MRQFGVEHKADQVTYGPSWHLYLSLRIAACSTYLAVWQRRCSRAASAHLYGAVRCTNSALCTNTTPAVMHGPVQHTKTLTATLSLAPSQTSGILPAGHVGGAVRLPVGWCTGARLGHSSSIAY